MKKNAFLTFLFACIPGAGQMYYGYMKRGLSLITYCCLTIMVGSVISPLLVLAIIVWMFSFFDTYDLIRYLVAGDPKPDEFLVPSNLGELKTILPKQHKLIGWGCIILGVWVLYDSVLSPVLWQLFDWLGCNGLWYTITNNLPSAVVAVLLVFAGTRLLGLGGPRRPHNDTDDLPPYQGQ